MKASDIPHIRLINQRFVGEKFKKSEEVVNWLGAVQSQDYPAAKWSLGLRTKNFLAAGLTIFLFFFLTGNFKRGFLE